MRGLIKCCIAAVMGAAAVGAAQASPFIVNISATSGQGTVFDPAPGWYTAQWIGTAQGGAYDAENVTCGSPTCTTGWTEGFVSFESAAINAIRNGLNGQYDWYTVNDVANYSSALAALNAFQTAGTVLDNHMPIVAGVPNNYWIISTDTIAQPWTFYFDGQPQYLVPLDGLTDQSNAYGGVSLLVTPTAVPEPATWTLMLGGVAGLGALLRRRRSADRVAFTV
ncbi:MAG: PEP-CTERM sorting domain-containing protein [Caulobacteraceae bacterium]|nr:PEP-CTERM sorting domain-containing protein [Caulobacteraceae bacterium]